MQEAVFCHLWGGGGGHKTLRSSHPVDPQDCQSIYVTLPVKTYLNEDILYLLEIYILCVCVCVCVYII